MYGAFKYESIPSGHDQYSANQQYSSKDDYSIKNTQQYASSTKPELAALNASSSPSRIGQLNDNESISQAINQPLAAINSPDQWSMNSYYDQNSYSSSTLLTPDSQHSNLAICNAPPNVQSNLQSPSTLQSPNVQAANMPPIQQNIQSNVQLNIHLNVQSNLHPAIDPNVPSVQANIRQSVAHQFANQLPDQLNAGQLANRLATQQMPGKTAFSTSTFGAEHYSSKDAPSAKKLKGEKAASNFNLNYGGQQAGYFHNSISQTRQQSNNQMQAADFQLQCNLPYQQMSETGNGFNNSMTNTHAEPISELSTDYYSAHQSDMGNAVESYHQQSIKSDQPDYPILNSANNSSVHHHKKLLGIDQSKPNACLSSLATMPQMQSGQPMDRSLNSSGSSNSYPTNAQLEPSYSYLQSATNVDMNRLPNQNCNQFSSTSLNNCGPNQHNQLNFVQHPAIRPLGQNKQMLNFNSIKCQKSLTVKRLIKQELKASIQSRMQNQSQAAAKGRFNLENSTASSNNSHKLVDRKEVPNCKLTNSKANQSRTSKPMGVILDEEEKRKRRRERNKLAATKCRNKKKAHVFKLSEQGTTLDINNKVLRNELASLRLEEQRLVQLLINHRRICNLKFTMIAHQLEQFYQPNSQGNFNAPTDFGQHNFAQPCMPADSGHFKNSRVKIESDYEHKLDNQMTNQVNSGNLNLNDPNAPNTGLNSQTGYLPIFNQPSPIIKIEDSYNYPPNYSDNRLSGGGQTNYQQQQPCFNQQTNPPPYQTVSSPQVNYDSFGQQQNITHYDAGPVGNLHSSISKLPSNESPGLVGADFMQCTNDTPSDSDGFSPVRKTHPLGLTNGQWSLD